MNGQGNRKLALPVGVSEFPEVAGGRYWFADKTLMVRDIIDEGAKAILITRPRRFGKSLNMGMLKSFFEMPEPGDDTARLFRDWNIWACGEEYTAHQGATPSSPYRSRKRGATPGSRRATPSRGLCGLRPCA